jgi:hypothetical protein
MTRCEMDFGTMRFDSHGELSAVDAIVLWVREAAETLLHGFARRRPRRGAKILNGVNMPSSREP